MQHRRHRSRVATPCCGKAVVATRLNTMQLGFPGVETPGYQQTSQRDEYLEIFASPESLTALPFGAKTTPYRLSIDTGCDSHSMLEIEDGQEWPSSRVAQARARRSTLRESHFASGSMTVKVLPLLRSLFTATLPPKTWHKCLTIANPKPVPPTSRERASSTR